MSSVRGPYAAERSRHRGERLTEGALNCAIPPFADVTGGALGADEFGEDDVS